MNDYNYSSLGAGVAVMVNSRSFNCLVLLQTVYLWCHRRDKDISSTCRYPCSLTATLPIVSHLPTIKVPFRQLMIQLCFCSLVAAFTNRRYDQKSAISRLISHPQSNQVTLQAYWKSYNTLLLHLLRERAYLVIFSFLLRVFPLTRVVCHLRFFLLLPSWSY